MLKKIFSLGDLLRDQHMFFQLDSFQTSGSVFFVPRGWERRGLKGEGETGRAKDKFEFHNNSEPHFIVFKGISHQLFVVIFCKFRTRVMS